MEIEVPPKNGVVQDAEKFKSLRKTPVFGKALCFRCPKRRYNKKGKLKCGVDPSNSLRYNICKYFPEGSKEKRGR